MRPFFVKKENPTESFPSISPYWLRIQRSLFAHAEECLFEVTAEHKEVMAALEVLHIEQYVQEPSGIRGRPRISRKALARAFAARGVLGLDDANDLAQRLVLDVNLRRICGFPGRAPSESTLSRVFTEFAENEMIRETVLEDQVRLHLGETVIPHISRDATSIEVREEPAPKPKKEPRQKKKMGRKKTGEPATEKVVTRLEMQREQTWQEALGELPKVCDFGSKFSSSGYLHHWKGYKLHVDIADGGVPISVCLTSASTHDTQAAIPLMKMTDSRTFATLYDLMDRGYDARVLREVSEELGHVPLIQGKARATSPAKPFDFAEEQRFKNRTVVERFFADLKDNHCGRNIRVRGWKKVLMHLMFGILAIFASAVMRI